MHSHHCFPATLGDLWCDTLNMYSIYNTTPFYVMETLPPGTHSTGLHHKRAYTLFLICTAPRWLMVDPLFSSIYSGLAGCPKGHRLRYRAKVACIRLEMSQESSKWPLGLHVLWTDGRTNISLPLLRLEPENISLARFDHGQILTETVTYSFYGLTLLDSQQLLSDYLVIMQELKS